MSRAFVKENDDPRAGDDQPELPRPSHPNLITPRGLEALNEREEQLLEERAELLTRDGDLEALSHLGQVERDLRYLEGRIAAAQVVDPTRQPTDEVAFGAHVTMEDGEGTKHIYSIVGEDEADPAAGAVSWVSPLARALAGARVGDLVTWRRPSGDLELEVMEISYIGH